MAIRCHHLGLISGLALALSLSAAADLSLSAADAIPPSADIGHIVFGLEASETPPFPAPVLFLAGGLLGLAAMVRWRQRMRQR